VVVVQVFRLALHRAPDESLNLSGVTVERGDQDQDAIDQPAFEELDFYGQGPDADPVRLPEEAQRSR